MKIHTTNLYTREYVSNWNYSPNMILMMYQVSLSIFHNVNIPNSGHLEYLKLLKGDGSTPICNSLSID